MRMIRLVLVIIFGYALLSACSPGELPGGSSTPTTRSTPAGLPSSMPEQSTPTESQIPSTQPEPVPTMFIPLMFQPAHTYIAQSLGVAPEEVTLASYEPVEWPDSCLGLAGPGEMCLQVITPGHLVFFDTPQGQTEVHTDRSGRTFRIAPNPAVPSPGALPGSGSGKDIEMSGIRGQVTIGPSCPGPVSANEPCTDQPYQATITIFNERGEQVNQVQTRSDGIFTVMLPPGTYILHPETSGAYPRAEDLEVVVGARQIIEVQITYDSGMR